MADGGVYERVMAQVEKNQPTRVEEFKGWCKYFGAHHRTIDRNTRMGRHLRVYLRFWREKVGDHHPHIASVGTLKEPGHRQAHSQKKKIVHFSQRRVTKLKKCSGELFFFSKSTFRHQSPIVLGNKDGSA